MSEPLGLADAAMMRGEHMRMLRRLAEQDDEERRAQQASDGVDNETDSCLNNMSGMEDQYTLLPSGRKLLNYDSYLEHQRYYDDLKHVDYDFIEYSCSSNCSNAFTYDGRKRKVIMEQRKSLGKGGICWDAAFILAEHLISNEKEWSCLNANIDTDTASNTSPQLLELGAGTGLAGYIVARECSNAKVIVTDLPDLLSLMKSNLHLNFKTSNDEDECGNTQDDDHNYIRQNILVGDCERKGAPIEAKVLRWGELSDYGDVPYDVVFGADVVASLYDPIALAHTFHDLCGPSSKIYLSYKGRLDEPHRKFEAELGRLFVNVKTIVPKSRNKNPAVRIIEASVKRQVP